MARLRQTRVGYKQSKVRAWEGENVIPAQKIGNGITHATGMKPKVKTINPDRALAFKKTLKPKFARVFEILADEISKHPAMALADITSNTWRRAKKEAIDCGPSTPESVFDAAVKAGAIKK